MNPPPPPASPGDTGRIGGVARVMPKGGRGGAVAYFAGAAPSKVEVAMP